MDIKELAEHARSFFTTHKRGEEEIYVTEKRHPTWIHKMIFRIHDNGNILPDDYKYEYTVDALDLLAEGNDPEDTQLEPDVYNHDLLKWLASHLERVGYVDEAAEDMGHSDQGIIGDIAQGQWREKDEVFHLVVDALKERLEAIEAGEDEEFEGDPKGVKEWRPR